MCRWARGDELFYLVVLSLSFWWITVILSYMLYLRIIRPTQHIYYVPHLVTAIAAEYSAQADHSLMGRSIRQRLLTVPNFPMRDEFALDLLDGTERVIQFILDNSYFRTAGTREASVGRLFQRTGP
jgi:hypothetical protein